jgi:hypothetical protein
VAIEGIRRYQLLQRQRRQRTKHSLLAAHHRQPFLPCGGSAEDAASSHLAGAFFNRQARNYRPYHSAGQTALRKSGTLYATFVS